MDAQAFTYWLHGWSEINGGGPPTATQWQIINDHLDLVFNKVTPDRQPHGARLDAKDAFERGFVQSGQKGIDWISSLTGHPPITGHVLTGNHPLNGYHGMYRSGDSYFLFPNNPPIFIC